MMSTVWRTSLAKKYEDAIDLLEPTLRECPDRLLGASVWEVKLTERHVWPIKQGVGAELTNNERLQLHSAFWIVAYHALLAVDDYLGGGLGDHTPPQPFRADKHQHSMGHSLPHRVYTREELLDYLAFCRLKAESMLADLTDEQAESPARGGKPFADLLLHNLLHLNEHVAQFNLFLNQRAQWSDGRGMVSDKWFRPCPDCQQ
jgi:hypothetical protein